jgi:hypothetical protein
MLDRNLGAVRDREYDVFGGAYPNDPLTARCKGGRAASSPICLCTRDGPSKGKCLDWAYVGMLEIEARHGLRFETIVLQEEIRVRQRLGVPAGQRSRKGVCARGAGATRANPQRVLLRLESLRRLRNRPAAPPAAGTFSSAAF